MQEVFTMPMRVRYADVDAHNRLRLPTLITQWQECGMAQMQGWGQGNGFTMDKGLLWIVTRQRLEISRLPGMDEDVSLCTWVGDCRHGLFLRSYQLLGSDGAVLARGAAQWSLLHAHSRTIEMKPGDFGVYLPPCVTGTELPRQRSLRPVEPQHRGAVTVPYSWLDANGHMNNVRYLDLAQDVLPHGGRPVRAVQIEYHREVLLGQSLEYGWAEMPSVGRDDPGTPQSNAGGVPGGHTLQTVDARPTAYYFDGAVDGQTCFRAMITYG